MNDQYTTAAEAGPATSISDDRCRTLATSFIEPLRARDERSLRNIVHGDVVWTLPGSSLISGVAHGVEGILARANKLSVFDVRIQIEHVAYGYEGVALLLHNTGTSKGKLLDEYLATICTLSDGEDRAPRHLYFRHRNAERVFQIESAEGSWQFE